MTGSMVFCRGCGKEIHETAVSCPHCGAIQGTVGYRSSQLKNRTTAALWCLFLGGIGAHRFYLGKTTDAVLRALFFWTLIPGIIASVEMLFIVFPYTDDNNKEWDFEYNNGIHTPPAHLIVEILSILSIIGGILLCVLLVIIIENPALIYNGLAARYRLAMAH